MGVLQCPRCGAEGEMATVAVGKLKEKQFRCGYCSTFLEGAESAMRKVLAQSQEDEKRAAQEMAAMLGGSRREFTSTAEPDFLFQETPAAGFADGTAVAASPPVAAAAPVAASPPPPPPPPPPPRRQSSKGPITLERESVMSPAAPGWASEKPGLRATSALSRFEVPAYVRMFGLVVLFGLAIIGLISIVR